MHVLKRTRSKFERFLPFLLTLGLATTVVTVTATPAMAADCGTVLATVNGVNVMSNGADQDKADSCGSPHDEMNSAQTPSGSTVNTGYMWQCVEFVNRYYVEKGWITSRWAGNGSTLKDSLPSGLSFMRNGSITSIVVGDVVTLNYSTYGHAGVVSAVNGNTITIANQNTSSVYGTATYDPVNETLTSEYSGFTTQGVIHAALNGGSNSVITVSPVVASLVTSDGVRHVYSGTTSGGLYETWWSATAGPTTWQLTNVGSAVTGISAQVTSDGNEHVYYGTQGGQVGEVWWGPGSNGVHMGQSWNMGTAVTAISSQVTSDGVQHIYSSNAAGSLYETWWGSSSATTWQVLNVGVNITAISSIVTSDGYEHIFYGATNGQVGEVWWGPGSNGGHAGYSSNVGTNVTAVTSQITSDGVRHIYTAAANGGLYETWWGYTSTGATTWQITNVGQHPTSVSSQVTSDGNEHVYYGTSFGQVGEVYWGAPTGGVVHLGQTYTDPSGTADSSVSSQVTSDGSQNVFFGNSSGSLFAMSWGVNPAVTSPIGTVS